MKRRFWSDEKLQRFAERWSQGSPLAVMAHEFHLTIVGVQKAKRDLRLPPRPHGHPRARQPLDKPPPPA